MLRVGFSGGTLIPAVFSAVFLLFPMRRPAVATTLAGMLAVLAPTVGPIVGGWITETYSWHWLFLINLAPGVLAAGSAIWLLPREAPRWGEARTLDIGALVLLAVSLASLEIALKTGPQHGWLSPQALALAVVSLATGGLFVVRTLRAAHPLVRLQAFVNRSFAVGCLLSFVLGIGLFGSVYLLPVFLGAVRGYGSLAIGEVMLVTGVAQLATAPVAVALERRVGARGLTALGFALFAAGLYMSTARDHPDGICADVLAADRAWRSDHVLLAAANPHGAGPPAARERSPTRSGLFNLMRNLGVRSVWR